MKQFIKNYTFNKTAKTVTFTDFSTVVLERVLLITDVTAGVIIYQFSDSAKGGTASGNVLTLTYNTSALNDADKLQIVYDSATGDPTYDSSTAISTGNVAAGATDSGNPVKVGGKYNATPPTLTTGQRGDIQLDSNANLKVSNATLLAGEDLVANVLKVEQRFTYANITTNTTTTVKSGPGMLHSITINNPSALTVTNLTLTIYDNTAGSGTKIGTVTVPFGQSTLMPFSVSYNVSFATGLTVVTAGPTVAADITVAFR